MIKKKKVDFTSTFNRMKEKMQPPVSKFDGAGIGKVIGVNPIKIQYEGKEISSTFIEMSPFCYEWKTQIYRHKHKYDDKNDGRDSSGSRENIDTSEELQEIINWRGLQVGDSITVLRTNNSQKYLILWRNSEL